VLEEDPEHGGTFMALPGQSHAVDLFQVKDAELAERQTPGVRGLGHLAFRVEDEEALKDAYATLREHNVEITRMIDHVSQKSVYFNDPDGNTLEIYFEVPDALEIFARGREDRDVAISLER
jgi:catechol-2,3-dioxygenase